MARLLSVNLGLPREITWRGKTVYTSAWKEPVQGRHLVRWLNIDGDAQGDLAGHGGEHRVKFVYQCGPPAFLEDFTAGLGGWGVAGDRIHTEIFGSGKSLTPGVKEAPHRLSHAPAGLPCKGPSISFARAGLTVSWDPKFQSLLELAEACDIPVRWSCRTGVCHTREYASNSGSVKYDPEPLEPPAEGNLLICCSRPREDLAIDI